MSAAAQLVHVHNPMTPELGAHRFGDVAGRDVLDVLVRDGYRLPPSTVLYRNGALVKRCDWNAAPIGDDEHVLLISLLEGRLASQIAGAIASIALAVFAPGIGTFLAGELGLGGTSILGVSTASVLTSAVLVGGQLVLSTLLPHPKPITQASPSPTYSLQAQSNRARLGEAIPEAFGKNMIMCDLIMAPWFDYADNNQNLRQGFCVGAGEYEIHQVRFGNAVIWQDGVATGAYPEVQIEVYGPDDPFTLFQHNVATSSEVQNITLLGTNEEDYDWAGPFVSSKPGTSAITLGFDICLPAGLFALDGNGHLSLATVSFEVSITQIDNDGNVLGGGYSGILLTQTLTLATRKAVFRSYTIDVSNHAGRYLVGMKRTNTKSSDTNVSDTLQWFAMRAYMPSVSDYPGITKIAMQAIGSPNLNGNTAQKFNVVCTRKLPIYDPGTQTWSAPAATRWPAWAAAYVLRSEGGPMLPDSRIALDQLVALDTTWAARGDCFDGIFDSRKSLWESLQSILRVGRARPLLAGSSVAFVRDEPKSVPSAAFNPHNMLPNSFSIDYLFPDEDAVDVLMIQFIDSRTWQPNQVLCALDDFDGDPEEAPPMQFFGISDYAQAWREGIAIVAQNRYRRMAPNFKTALEGRTLFLGSPINVAHWLPNWATTADVIALDEDDAGDILTLSEPWSVPEGDEALTKLIRLSAPDGRVYGPVMFDLVDDGADTLKARVRLLTAVSLTLGKYAGDQPRDWPVWNGDGLQLERPRAMLGTASEQPQSALVVSMKPDTNGATATVSCVIDDPRVHTADLGDPPVEIGGPSSTLSADLVIDALALTESTPASGIGVAVVVTGAADATTFDAQWKLIAATSFGAPVRDLARSFAAVVPAGVVTLQVRAKGAAGYGPWFAVTFNADGTGDSVPANVGTITGSFTSGQVNHYTWAAVSGALSYLIQVWARPSGVGSHQLVRSVEIATNGYYYYPANEIDDGGPMNTDLYIAVKAKNSAGSSPTWTNSP